MGWALSAFGIEEGNPFRDCIDSLTIELNQVKVFEWRFG